MHHLTNLTPGRVVLVRHESLFARAIRLGAALLDEPNLHDHVAVVHHVDAGGTLWGIEGRPGGVGWIDMTAYLRSPATIANTNQPLTPAQGEQIAESMKGILGCPYDWVGIAADAAHAVDHLWHPDLSMGAVPGHVVCSSAADWAYMQAGVMHPGGFVRTVTPADWEDFMIANGFES